MGRACALLVLWTSILCASRGYQMDGIVVRFDAVKKVVRIAHRPVAGVMPAMTMDFAVDSVPPLNPGARVRFVANFADRPVRAHSLRVIPPDTGGISRPPEALAAGAVFPDFQLTDSAGQRVHLKELRGRVVAIQFIYTRCPLADVCPRLAAHFAYLQKRFASRLEGELELLSITIDPDHDTPAVLKSYARQWKAGSSWRFLTGPVGEIAKVASAAGLIFWPDEGAIGHTSATVLLRRDGRVGATLEGSNFRADQLESLVTQLLEDSK